MKFKNWSSTLMMILVVQAATISLLSSSASQKRLYDKLRLKTAPLCADPSNASLILNKNRLQSSQVRESLYARMCAIQCQTLNGACFAFQVNVMKSINDGNAYDVRCYSFNDFIHNIYKPSPDDDCSLFMGASKYKIVDVLSWGFKDSLNLKEFDCPPKKRGVNLYKLDMQSRAVYDSQSYDLLDNAGNVFKIKNYLMNTANGTVVVCRTCDEPYTNINQIVPYLKSVNLDISAVQYRGKWIFVWQQGAYEKTLSYVDNSNVSLSKQFLIYNMGL
ncbi:hypothetical protein HELRODRAFT_177965 [Helobdella robusta]|uniref:ILEI/PANDER domain-containing protein n=1 Tax=Helobdella robusta TaxID=6412 RepID=T1FCJ1_HELRO|nr:hypothetical protein HELRODRAFT_177965 [Helobdella robusta]ESN97534.1 hypothetical protein HELRODRAFT_177965 [Helobdella robusta]